MATGVVTAPMEPTVADLSQQSAFTGVVTAPMELTSIDPSQQSAVTRGCPMRCFSVPKKQQSAVKLEDPPKRPAKVEPKTFFANERTFIQWLSPVMILVTGALGLQSAGNILHKQALFWAGAIINCVGVMWLLYALYVYLKRMRKIENHDSTGYQERKGPIFLVILMMGAVLMATFVLASTNGVFDNKTPTTDGPWNNTMSPTVPTVYTACGRAVAEPSSFSSLNVEPSGLLHHATRGSLFVPSLYKLFEVAADGGMAVEIPLAGLDIESVTMDPNNSTILYLGVERAKGAEIHSFDLDKMKPGPTIALKDTLGSLELEALAFCPASVCGAADMHFLVAGRSSKVSVIRMKEFDDDEDVEVVDSFDIDDLRCQLAGQCSGTVDSIKALQVMLDGTIYAVSKRDELYVMRSAHAGTHPMTITSMIVFPLPADGNWEGVSVREQVQAHSKNLRGKPKTLLLASDKLGAVVEFNLTRYGLEGSAPRMAGYCV